MRPNGSAGPDGSGKAADIGPQHPNGASEPSDTLPRGVPDTRGRRPDGGGRRPGRVRGGHGPGAAATRRRPTAIRPRPTATRASAPRTASHPPRSTTLSQAQREEATAERFLAGIERSRSAAQRASAARGARRDREGARRRRARAADREAEALAAAAGPESAEARLAKLRRRAALDRARAAADRERAARDREAAGADRERAELELQRAYIDELTGAYLRTPGRLALQRELDRASRSDDGLVLAFVDVNDLKGVNDRTGHAGGDRVLQAVVKALRNGLRSFDPIVRYGGDEFVCALSGAGEEEVKRRFAEILEAVRDPARAGYSVGLATLERGDTLDELIDRADAAVYRAKRA